MERDPLILSEHEEPIHEGPLDHLSPRFREFEEVSKISPEERTGAARRYSMLLAFALSAFGVAHHDLNLTKENESRYSEVDEKGLDLSPIFPEAGADGTVSPANADAFVKEIERSEEDVRSDTLKGQYSKELLKEYDRLKAVLLAYVGQKPVDEIERGEILAIGRRKLSPAPPIIEGFENTKADVGLLKKVWKEGAYYPVGWINGEIDVIQFDDAVKKMDTAAYGEKLKGMDVAADVGEQIVTFYARTAVHKESAVVLSEALDVLFAHEIGHENDWIRSMKLSLFDRARLLEEVIGRVRSARPTVNTYVDSIELEDKKAELYQKCTEYWAEMCSRYFTSPELLSKEDFALVDTYVLFTDSKFEPYKRAHDKYMAFHPTKPLRAIKDFTVPITAVDLRKAGYFSGYQDGYKYDYSLVEAHKKGNAPKEKKRITP